MRTITAAICVALILAGCGSADTVPTKIPGLRIPRSEAERIKRTGHALQRLSRTMNAGIRRVNREERQLEVEQPPAPEVATSPSAEEDEIGQVSDGEPPPRVRSELRAALAAGYAQLHFGSLSDPLTRVEWSVTEAVAIWARHELVFERHREGLGYEGLGVWHLRSVWLANAAGTPRTLE